jgi:hypothetical protein
MIPRIEVVADKVIAPNTPHLPVGTKELTFAMKTVSPNDLLNASRRPRKIPNGDAVDSLSTGSVVVEVYVPGAVVDVLEA